MCVAFSVVGLLFVIWTIATHKNLQQHPSKLIMFICVTEGMFVWQSFITSNWVTSSYFSCYFDLGSSLSFFLRKGNSYTAEYIVAWINNYLKHFFEVLAITSNTCLCHDLIKTLSTPFDAGEKRLKIYIMFSIFVSIMTTNIVFIGGWLYHKYASDPNGN